MSGYDDENQIPTGQRGQKWAGGQVWATMNDSEQHIQTIRPNRTT